MKLKRLLAALVSCCMCFQAEAMQKKSLDEEEQSLDDHSDEDLADRETPVLEAMLAVPAEPVLPPNEPAEIVEETIEIPVEGTVWLDAKALENSDESVLREPECAKDLLYDPSISIVEEVGGLKEEARSEPQLTHEIVLNEKLESEDIATETELESEKIALEEAVEVEPKSEEIAVDESVEAELEPEKIALEEAVEVESKSEEIAVDESVETELEPEKIALEEAVEVELKSEEIAVDESVETELEPEKIALEEAAEVETRIEELAVDEEVETEIDPEEIALEERQVAVESEPEAIALEESVEEPEEIVLEERRVADVKSEPEEIAVDESDEEDREPEEIALEELEEDESESEEIAVEESIEKNLDPEEIALEKKQEAEIESKPEEIAFKESVETDVEPEEFVLKQWDIESEFAFEEETDQEFTEEEISEAKVLEEAIQPEPEAVVEVEVSAPAEENEEIAIEAIQPEPEVVLEEEVSAPVIELDEIASEEAKDSEEAAETKIGEGLPIAAEDAEPIETEVADFNLSSEIDIPKECSFTLSEIDSYKKESQQQTTDCGQECVQPAQEPEVCPAPQKVCRPLCVDDDMRVVFSCFKGLYLHCSNRTVKVAELEEIEGVETEGVDLPGSENSLARFLCKYWNAPLTKCGIKEIKRKIIQYYREHDRPIVHIQVPPQAVRSGVLQLIVNESRLGCIRSSGNRHFASERLEGSVRLTTGDPIRADSLITDLNWLNRNPFRTTDLAFKPSSTEGYTDIELLTHDKFPFRVYGGIDNTGIAQSGHNRWFTGFNCGNLFWLDHIFNYQFTSGMNYHKFWSHTVNYTAPLSWRHILEVYGGYSQVKAPLKHASGTRTHGSSAEASLRYQIPLPPGVSFLEEFTWGLDWKRTNVNLTENDSFIFGKTVNLTQLMAGFDAGYETANTKTSGTLEIFYSPGDWLPDQKTSLYNDLRAGAKNAYVYGRATIGSFFLLPADFALVPSLRLQYSSANLLASEQMGLGGHDTVRGYNEREISADNGILANLELRTCPLSVLGLIKEKWKRDLRDELRFLAFIDFGYAREHHRNFGEKASQYLLSIGPGLRYIIRENLTVRCDYGFKLHQLEDTLNPNHRMLHFGILLSL